MTCKIMHEHCLCMGCVTKVPPRADMSLLSHQAIFQVLQCELSFYLVLSSVPVCGNQTCRVHPALGEAINR